nr:FAD synthase-like [Vanessa tameamea]
MDFENTATVLEETEQVIRECFTQFQLDEVFLSFNGGKDCTVLLDVTINILKDLYKRDDIGKDLKIVYIRTIGPFKEIENFVKEIEKLYGVKIIVTEGEIKTTLQRTMEQDSKLKACLLGTRRTDPYSEGLKFMQKTDINWPQIVRVSPLLNWSYHQIWSYILQKQVPYCSLYDKGYTSIGSIHNTWPNPSLSYKDSFGRVTHRPAWMLADPTLERAGRGTNNITVTEHAVQNPIDKCLCIGEVKSDVS